jgi:hypothetical protein
MCVKFGGIWCHPRLEVPEKQPTNGPESGVCLRGCKMMSFWPKTKRKTVPDRGILCASDSKKFWLVYCSDWAVVTSQRCKKLAIFYHYAIVRTTMHGNYWYFLNFSIGSAKFSSVRNSFPFVLWSKTHHFTASQTDPTFWAVFGQFFRHCQTRMAPNATKLDTHNLQKIAVILVFHLP